MIDGDEHSSFLAPLSVTKMANPLQIGIHKGVPEKPALF